MPPGALVAQGDIRHLPLRSGTVDLAIMSPPYFQLRDYRAADQIGLESSPHAYLDSLIEATAAVAAVCKPSASIFVNLGDKYCGYSGEKWGQGHHLPGRSKRTSRRVPASGPKNAPQLWGVPNKSLLGLPWRYAIRCVDELGLVLRAEIVWSKDNGLPESVVDRVRRSHEQWFHFSLADRYYSALDEIREPYAPATAARYAAGYQARDYDGERLSTGWNLGGDTYEQNPLGRLPGSVWNMPTEPLLSPDYLVADETGWRLLDPKPLYQYAHWRYRAGNGLPIDVEPIDHYAAFPSEWPRRFILGWSPPAVCTACNVGRRPRRGNVCSECGHVRPTQAKRCPECGHVRAWKTGRSPDVDRRATTWSTPGNGTPRTPGGWQDSTVVDGWACDCPTPAAPTRPAVVLDAFGGAGTTAMVAKALGRLGVSIDLSLEYSRLAAWRVWQSDHWTKIHERTNRARQGSLL